MARPRALDAHARERMAEARAVIAALVEEGAVVYGVTTGFGDLARRPSSTRPAPPSSSGAS